MTNPNTEAAPQTAPQETAEAPASDVVQLTREEYNRAMSAARKDGEARAAKRVQSAPSQTATPSAVAPAGDELSVLRAELADMRQRQAYDRYASEHKLSSAQADRLYPLFKAEAPQDAGEWFGGVVAAFNLQPQVSQAPSQTPQPSAQAKPAAAPADSQPRQVGITTTNGVPDLGSLSADDIKRMGPQALRAAFEQVTSIAAARSGTPPIPHHKFKKG